MRLPHVFSLLRQISPADVLARFDLDRKAARLDPFQIGSRQEAARGGTSPCFGLERSVHQAFIQRVGVGRLEQSEDAGLTLPARRCGLRTEPHVRGNEHSDLLGQLTDVGDAFALSPSTRQLPTLCREPHGVGAAELADVSTDPQPFEFGWERLL